MLFKPELIKQIVIGRKTQTRRPVKPDDKPLNYWGGVPGDVQPWGATGEHDEIGVVQRKDRDLWRMTQSYAVQPGRGKPCLRLGDLPFGTTIPEGFRDTDPMRIRITRIRREDVRKINFEDARAEGFDHQGLFLSTWTWFYDKVASKALDSLVDALTIPREYAADCTDWEAWYEVLQDRPAHLYDAWVLNFVMCHGLRDED